jgi:hypothetical protein
MELRNLSAIVNSGGASNVVSTTGAIEKKLQGMATNSMVANASNFEFDNLTAIRQEIIQTKYYEVNPADFIPINYGFGAYLDVVIRRFRQEKGNDSLFARRGVESRVSANYEDAQMTMHLHPYTESLNYNLYDVKQAAALGYNSSVDLMVDLIREKELASKKTFDLSLQKALLKGEAEAVNLADEARSARGLLNLTVGGEGLSTSITEDTTTLSGFIGDLGDDDFKTAVKGMIEAYRANTNNTVAPNTLIIPTAEAAKLATSTSSFNNNVTRLDILQQMFTAAFGSQVTVKQLFYANKAQDLAGKNRYVLYNNNSDSLICEMPIPYTSFGYGTENNFDYKAVAMAQVSGVYALRPSELMYFTHTA